MKLLNTFYKILHFVVYFEVESGLIIIKHNIFVSIVIAGGLLGATPRSPHAALILEKCRGPPGKSFYREGSEGGTQPLCGDY